MNIKELKSHQGFTVLNNMPVSIIRLSQSDEQINLLLENIGFFYKDGFYYSLNLENIESLITSFFVEKILNADIEYVNTLYRYFDDSIRSVIFNVVRCNGIELSKLSDSSQIPISTLSNYLNGKKGIKLISVERLLDCLNLAFYYEGKRLTSNIRESLKYAVTESEFKQTEIAEQLGISKQNFSGFLNSVTFADGQAKTISYLKLKKCLNILKMTIK